MTKKSKPSNAELISMCESYMQKHIDEFLEPIALSLNLPLGLDTSEHQYNKFTEINEDEQTVFYLLDATGKKETRLDYPTETLPKLKTRIIYSLMTHFDINRTTASEMFGLWYYDLLSWHKEQNKNDKERT